MKKTLSVLALSATLIATCAAVSTPASAGRAPVKAGKCGGKKSKADHVYVRDNRKGHERDYVNTCR